LRKFSHELSQFFASKIDLLPNGNVSNSLFNKLKF